MVVVVVIVMAVVAPDWLWFEHMSNIETRAFKKRGKERGAGLGGQKGQKGQKGQEWQKGKERNTYMSRFSLNFSSV